MKLLLLSLCVVLSLSCKNGNKKVCSSYARISIVNKGSTRKFLEIRAFQNGSIKSLLPSKRIEKRRLCFDNSPKIDGNYFIHVRGGKIDSISQFGYFSNGVPEQTWYQIIIFDNSYKVIQHPSTDKF